MMGKRGTLPLALLDGFLGRPAVPEGSIYHVIAHSGAARFEDEAFAGMYAERGRPSCPPSMMLKVVLLAFADNTSDREAEERCRFDLRWKYALGLRFDEERPDATTLCRFRARLIVNDQAGAAFVRTLRWAREKKVLGGEHRRVGGLDRGLRRRGRAGHLDPPAQGAVEAGAESAL